MPTLEERVTALETALHNYTTWVVYWDSNASKYTYSNINYVLYYGIQYEPTEYRSAAEARQAANSLNR